MKGIKEGPGEFVLSGCDGAVDLKMSDHALDAIALAIDVSVPSNRRLSVRTRRDGGSDAVIAQGDAKVLAAFEIALAKVQTGR